MPSKAVGGSLVLKRTDRNSAKIHFLSKLSVFALMLGMVQIFAISNPASSNAVPTQGSIRTSSNAGVQFGTQNTALTPSFTIEAWWKWADGLSPSLGQLLLGGSGTPGIYIRSSNQLQLTRWGGGYDSPYCTLQNSFVAGTWYHLAIGRSSGGLVTVWVNGSPLQNCSKLTVPAFTVGTQFPSFFGGNGAGALFDGYFANYRATSTDEYGAAEARGFQPKSNFYTSITGTINLLNTPNDNATVFSDSIGAPSGFTTHTGGTLSSEFPTYSPQSICFGGTQARYFSFPSGNTIGTSSFTLEMWVKPKTWSAYMSFLNTGYGAGGGSYLGYNTDTGKDKIIFYNGETIGSNGLGTDAQQKVPQGVWSHVAFVRDQTKTKNYLYINGIKVNEGASSNYNFARTQLDIGSNFDGCMTSVRLAKSALYASTFTPAALGSFSLAPDGTDVLVALTAGNNSITNIASSYGSILGTGTITYESIKSSSRTIVFTATNYSLNNGDTQTVTANISAGTGAISYSAGVSTACTVDSTSGLVTINSGTGTCSISATSAEDDNYVAATTTIPVTITVNKMLQSAVSITLSPTTKVIKSGFSQVLTTLSGSGGSGTGAFSYTVSTVTAGANCALANNAGTFTLSADTAGTCTLTATRASDASYQSGSASTNFIFSTPIRTLSFATTAYTLAYLATQQVTATASANGGPTVITYSAGASTACSVGANTGIVSITASTGTCSISASVAEDVTYLATSTVTPVSITVGKANQAPVTLSISPTSKNSLAPFTQELVTLSATGGTGTGVMAYSISDITAGATCQLTNNAGVYTITASTAGTCSVTATKPADTNYFEASNSKTFSFNANRTLTYAAGLGGGVKSGVTAPTAGPFLTGDTFAIAAGSAYERAGFSFTGWSDGTNTFAAGDNYTVASANITLTAQWRQTSLFGILDADLEEMQSWNASNRTNSGTISNTAGTSSVTVTVPANSLTSGTTVKLWELKNSDFAKSKVDPSKDYIVNLVLSWLKDNGVGQAQTVPTASTPITLSISNNTIKKGAIAYQIIGDVVTQIGTATADGVLNLSITEDPVISIANPIVEAPNNGGGGGGGGGGGNNVVTPVEKVVEPIKAVEVVPITIKTIQFTHKIFFGLNASWINSANIKSLKDFISNLAIDTKINEVLIQGFTQPTAINPDPAGLSKARANSVAKLIKAQGINSKILAVGKGNEKKNLPTSRYVLITVTGESKS